MYEDDEQVEAGSVDMLLLIDDLVNTVDVGKRVPFSGRVMVEADQFMDLIEQLRVAVPDEIRQAQVILRERELIIAEAQEEAAKIVDNARKRAEYFVSEQGILNEARQRSEEILRQTEERRKRDMGEIDVYAAQQLNQIEEALQEGLEIIDSAVQETVARIRDARDAIGR